MRFSFAIYAVIIYHTYQKSSNTFLYAGQEQGMSEIVIITLVVLAIGVSLFSAYTILKQKKKVAPAVKPAVSADRITDYDAIAALLETALQTKAHLRIRLNNRGTSFNSIPLAIKPSDMIIDTLFPQEGNDLLKDTDFISVECIIRESAPIPYRFSSTIIGTTTFNDYPALTITLPREIKRDQKRNFHRVTPSINEDVDISFRLDDDEISEKVTNISGGGVGFYTNNNASVLWPGRSIEDITITLPDTIVIQCMSVIHTFKHIEYPVLINGKSYHYYCGAEFTSLDDATRDAVIKYVIEKERVELQRINRKT